MSGKTSQVEKLAIDSSKYLRSNLKNNDRKYNTIRQEIRLAQEYLKIVNAMSAVPVQLRIHDIHNMLQTEIPNMILQPLVENSIKHGIPPRSSQPFFLDFTIQRIETDGVRLTLKDNGVGYKESVIQELSKLQIDTDYQPSCIGFGTAGVIRRLYLQYGTDFVFEARNDPDGGAVTIVQLLRVGI